MMHTLLEPKSIEAFLARVVEVAPEESPAVEATSFLAIAEEWQSMGLRKGDMVLLRMSNGKALLHHFFGALLAGGVPALVGNNVPSARLREMASVMSARAIASTRALPEEVGAASDVKIGGAVVHEFENAAAPAAGPGQLVLLTSGTSGLSSGCLFDVEASLLNAARHAAAIGQRRDDAVLVNLPLHFSFALVAQALGSLVTGNRLVIGGPPFHVPTFIRTLERFEVTIASLTPVLVRTLLESGAEFPDRLRVLSVGGDSLASSQVEKLLRKRPGKELYLTYGLTQAGPRVSTLAAHLEPAKRYSSVGKPLAGTAVSLREIEEGSGMKELFVSSATVMKRHVGRVEGRPERGPLPAGMIATGDVFEQDEEGYLYYKGRLTDYISRNGEKICLAAVRRVASQLPHVISAKTVRIRDDDGTEDFDLELRMDASASVGPGEVLDGGALLRGLLRRADMPRSVRIMSGEAVANSYK